MKIKDGFVLHTVGDENVVVAIGKMTTAFSGMIRLNSTGAFLFKLMEKECDEKSLISALIDKYGITEDMASEAVSSFVDKLKETGVLDI